MDLAEFLINEIEAIRKEMGAIREATVGLSLGCNGKCVRKEDLEVLVEQFKGLQADLKTIMVDSKWKREGGAKAELGMNDSRGVKFGNRTFIGNLSLFGGETTSPGNVASTASSEGRSKMDSLEKIAEGLSKKMGGMSESVASEEKEDCVMITPMKHCTDSESRWRGYDIFGARKEETTSFEMSGRKVNIDREMGSVSWSLTIEGLVNIDREMGSVSRSLTIEGLGGGRSEDKARGINNYINNE